MPETEDKSTIAIEPHPQTRLLLRLFYFIPIAFAEDAKNCIAAYPLSIFSSLSQSRHVGRLDFSADSRLPGILADGAVFS